MDDNIAKQNALFVHSQRVVPSIIIHLLSYSIIFSHLFFVFNTQQEAGTSDTSSEDMNPAKPKGRLSSRMLIPGNTWLTVWESARPVPARRQVMHCLTRTYIKSVIHTSQWRSHQSSIIKFYAHLASHAIPVQFSLSYRINTNINFVHFLISIYRWIGRSTTMFSEWDVTYLHHVTHIHYCLWHRVETAVRRYQRSWEGITLLGVAHHWPNRTAHITSIDSHGNFTCQSKQRPRMFLIWFLNYYNKIHT